jgi:NAD dependent epimerase/dehydratase
MGEKIVSWKGKRVLVTGAGGFIGSHLTERLAEQGATVRALVHYNALGLRGWLDASPLKDKVDIVAGDICDRDSVRNAARDVEVIFHLAALIAIPYSYSVPASYVRTNVEGTVNILQTARDLKVGRVVHTSTSEVYGTARYVPIDEAHPLQGQSPYSASKIAADKMAESFHCSFGLPVVTVRPFNTFGPRQSARAVIPTIITQCLKREEVRLGNVEPTRDLNFVSNIVDGFLAAGSEPGAIGLTINLGSGREISIADLATLIGKLTNRPVKVEREEQRVRPDKSEVERLLASNKLAADVLKWQPKIALEQGLEQTIRWLEQNLDKYRTDAYVV